MKFSAAVALAIAPLALAKSVHNVYPVRREQDQKGQEKQSQQQQQGGRGNNNGGNNNNNNNGGNIIAVPAVVQAQSTEIIIVWANPGGNAATTTLGQQVTVTQTVTAGAQATQVGSNTIPPGATSAVAAPGATHSVTVGGTQGLAYSPASINAAVGDMVVFTFMSNNHSATQSAFATPCDPLAGGMDSGFQPNPNNTVTPPPQVAMQVMTTTPLWFYCRQTGHCGQGMTFSVNPTADKTQAMFQAMAIQQKGKGTGSAITGNSTSAQPAAAPPAAGSSAAPAAGSSSAPSSGSAGSIQQGQGTVQGGACVCAVSCGAGAFPAVQAQGLGAFGGVAGSLPASMMEV